MLIHRLVKDAIVIPQRATFANLGKRYVYIVRNNDIVSRREILRQYEWEDTYVIEGGLNLNDRIVLEGIRQVREGEKIEYEFRPPEEVIGKLKTRAE